MRIKAETFTDEGEEVTASFDVTLDADDELEAEFIDAYLEPRIQGSTRTALTESQLDNMGLLCDLEEQAFALFNYADYEEEERANLADTYNDLMRDG